MSAVDVIDAAINKVRQHAWPQTMDLEEARAAVAELIEALRLCRDELIGIDGHITDPDNPDGWTDGDLYAAYAKACAALVRCGGTK